MNMIFNFTKRNLKELLRDYLSWIFAIILPIFLLWIFTQFKIPNEAYKLENFTPCIIIFGFAFLTMFSALLVAEDRSSSLLLRLTASPMKPYHYILGYYFSLLPLALLQSALFFLVALPLGLSFSINVILCTIASLFVATLYIFLGILIGSITSSKSSSGLSSVVVQLVAFTSGMYFSSDLVGGFFNFICNALPFKSSLDLLKSVLLSNYTGALLALIIYLVYTLIAILLSVILFKRSLLDNKK